MKRPSSRWATPALVAGLLLVVCAGEAWQLARLRVRQGEISRELAASPGAAASTGAPSTTSSGEVAARAEVDGRLAEATAELARETAHLSAAEAKRQAAEAALPQLKDEELRSLGHLDQFALGAAEWLDTLAQFDSAMKDTLGQGKELGELDERTTEFLSAIMSWQGKIGIVAEMEDTPAEIGKFHAATIAQRLNLDGPTLNAVRVQIEKEFTDLAAAQLTESYCPKVNPDDWRKRRAAALAEATKRVEALIPSGRNRPDVVAQSLSLGGAVFSNVTVQPDGHGSANFGVRLPGLSAMPGH